MTNDDRVQAWRDIAALITYIPDLTLSVPMLARGEIRPQDECLVYWDVKRAYRCAVEVLDTLSELNSRDHIDIQSSLQIKYGRARVVPLITRDGSE